MTTALRLSALCFAVTLSAAAFAKDPVLHIDADKTTAKVSPTLYGLMTEEINYSYDGGLYGELVQNRNFKGDWAHPNDGSLAHWSLVKPEGSPAEISLDKSSPVNEALPFALKLDATSLPADNSQKLSITNDGYWGFPIRPSTPYKASFFAKASPDFKGPLTLSLQSADGKTTFATVEVPQLTDTWKTYTATLATQSNVTPTAGARFVLSTSSPGTLWLNLVSLFPPTYNNRPNGNRVDLMQKLVDMKPAFLRFPGGNYLEGDTIDQRFDWKKTIGPIATRPGHQSPWKYMSTDGMGLLEFLEWTEDMHAQPVLAVFAGYALKGAHVEPGPDLAPFVQDALDEIEYVTGDASTKWGARRIADGHPEPFPLQFVEVGNEDSFDKSKSYDGRFAQFFDAIKAKYPAIKVIATTRVTSRNPDLVDDHYYRQARQFERDAHHYDKYKRGNGEIFVGEWATREGEPTTNMNAALGDAAWLTGMERNSDLIAIACYAPLFVNVNKGGMQWRSDLIGYNALTSYGSPSYYVQKMFNTHLGDTIPESSLSDVPTGMAPPNPGLRGRPAVTEPAPIDLLYYAITKDSKKGLLFLKVVNIDDKPQPLHIEIAGEPLAPTASMSVLSSASIKDTNTIDDPGKIVPVDSTINDISNNFTHTFPPYSVTILQMSPASPPK